MATLNGAIRSYGAAVRRMEREQQRKARESAKRFKEQQKLQEIKNAQQAVADWEDYVETLQSIHKNCTTPVDWNQIKNTNKPIEPILESKHEIIAINKLENFKPSFFDKLFGLTQKKINRLKDLLKQAKAKDNKEYDVNYKEYLDELNNWQELQEISNGIKNKETDFYKKALQYFDPFSDIGELGTQISFGFEQNYIDIDLHVNSLDNIPNYELKQTSTGKLSKKNMPKTRFNELYQDHICSASMRVAREVFAYLPIDYARINAVAKIVNTKTGHLEEQPILSVIFPPQTINSLNLETIDPSDSMQNFVHNMNFSKTKGFSAVEKAELEK
jgi:O6-methylguanine-DNA--protein-cysteine methyltransferase